MNKGSKRKSLGLHFWVTDEYVSFETQEFYREKLKMSWSLHKVGSLEDVKKYYEELEDPSAKYYQESEEEEKIAHANLFHHGKEAILTQIGLLGGYLSVQYIDTSFLGHGGPLSRNFSIRVNKIEKSQLPSDYTPSEILKIDSKEAQVLDS